MASPRALSRLVPLLAAAGFALVAACASPAPTGPDADVIAPSGGPAFLYSDSVAREDSVWRRRP